MRINSLIITCMTVIISSGAFAQSTSPDSMALQNNLNAADAQVLPPNSSPVITFSEYAIGSTITNQYQNIGMIFTGSTFITSDGANPTSPVLSGTPRFQGPITCTFVKPGTTAPTIVKSFTFDAGYFDNFGSTRIEWFDPAGNKLGQRINSHLGIETFTIDGGNIASWKISVIASEPAGFAIDNVSFVLVGPSILFREVIDSEKEGTWGFAGDEIPGFDHTAFHFQDVVYESHPGYESGMYLTDDGSPSKTIVQEDGVQHQHTRGTFRYDDTSPGSHHVADLDEIPIDEGLANTMRNKILLVESHTFRYINFSFPDGLSQTLSPAAQKGGDNKFTCVGLIEWAAEQSGYRGGQGFINDNLESFRIPDPRNLSNEIEVPLLSPELLNFAMKGQQLMAGVKQWVQGLLDPVDFIITDPLGRRLGYTPATGLLNEIPNAFFSGNGHVEQFLVPTAIPGTYRIQLFGTGDTAFAAVGALDSSVGFRSVLAPAQTAEKTLYVRPTSGCKGDVNNDGQVNTVDITALIPRLNSFTNGLGDPGDLDGNGEINNIDLQLLTQLVNLCTPIIVCPPVTNLCFSNTNSYIIAPLTITGNCTITTTTYTITGATTRTGTGNNASGVFNIGTSTIVWTVIETGGNTNTCSTTVNVLPLPVVSITISSPNDFCNKLTLTANPTLSGPFSYTWSYGTTPFATTKNIQLDNANGDGMYKVFVTDGNGCLSAAPATYTYLKQNTISNYTIIGLKESHLDDYNNVQTGSVGVTKYNGTAEFRRNNSVASPGSFVKARYIQVLNPANIPTRILAPATVALPVMQYNTASTMGLLSYTVNQNVTVTLSGNYRELRIKKGAIVTLNGTIFGKITVNEKAKVIFSQPVINIEELVVEKGTNTGYTYIQFLTDASVRVKKQVTIQEKARVNPDSKKVTFYLGDTPCDEEKFMVKANDTRVIANVYIPDGKLRIVAAHSSSCGGPANSTISTYMTGLFIAEDVDGEGENVIWNSYACNPTNPASSQHGLSENIVEESSIKTIEKELMVKASPNPSSSSFRIRVDSNSNEAISIRIYDANGRAIELKTGVQPGMPVIMGSRLSAGIYYAEVIQGKEKKVVKLVKVN